MPRMPGCSLLVFTTMLVVLLGSAPAAAQGLARVGHAAPDFVLPDLEGRPIRLSRYKEKVVVLQWFDVECPFNGRVYRDGTVQKTVAAMKTMGPDYVYMAVNSTAIKPADNLVIQSRSFLKLFEVDVPVLIDADGKVARRFGVKKSPQVFVIDHGVIKYSGAFTDNEWGTKRTTRNFVLNALELIRRGEKVEPATVKPWGCGIKHRSSAP